VSGFQFYCPSFSRQIKAAPRRQAGCLKASLDSRFTASPSCSSPERQTAPFRGEFPQTEKTLASDGTFLGGDPNP